MKAKLIILSALLLLAMIGCGEDTTNVTETGGEERYHDGRVIGSVHGVVMSGTDAALLEDITVWASVEGDIVSTRTDAQGYYDLTGLPSGNYLLTFVAPEADKAATYATSMVTVHVPRLDEILMDVHPHTQDFEISVNVGTQMLWPLSADLSGRVYKQIDNEDREPAGGVTVIVDFAGTGLSVDEYSAESDTNGMYGFMDLPAAPINNIRSLPHNDGQDDYGVGALLGLVPALVPDGMVHAPALLLNRGLVAPIIVDNNYLLNDVGLGEDLTISFSLPMNQETSNFALHRGTTAIPIETAWTGDAEVTIDPYMTLMAGATYTLTINAWSIDGARWNGPGPFTQDFNTVAGIALIHTNVTPVDGGPANFAVGDDITMLFNMVPDLDNVNTVLQLSRNGGPVVYTDVSVSGAMVTLNPANDLAPGTAYVLTYTVYSAYAGDNVSGTANFTTAPAPTVPGAVTGFAFDDPGLDYDYDSTTFTFDWNVVDGVAGYYIYAWNDANKSEKVRVASYGNQTTNTGTVNLGAWSAVFGADPLVDDVSVSFQIMAYTTTSLGPLSSTVLTASDGTAPTVTFGAPTGGSADNSLGTDPKVLTVNVSSSEPLDTSFAPDFSITDGGAAYTLLQSALSFQYAGDRMGGVLTITVPAGVDASGDEIEIDECRDSSGNEQTADDSIALP